MGHLINPIAFRLSSLKSWEDSWFVKNVYYPEFFNGMLKVRNYLYYFLTSKKILKSGIFLSNFFIVKYNKIYIINIYIYHIDFERLSYDCINRLYGSFFSYNRNNKVKKVGNFFKLFVNNLDIFFFLILFQKIFCKKRKIKKKKKAYINFNIFFKSNDFKDYNKKLLCVWNNLTINKLLNIKNLNASLNNIKLSKDYNYKILLFYNKILLKNKIFDNFNYKSFNLSKKLSINKIEKKLIGLKADMSISRFTFFEFMIFLLQKLGLNFKNVFFNKILRLKKVLPFLNILKYFKFKSFKLRVNYNFLLYFLIALLKGLTLSLLNNYNYNKNFYFRKNKVRTKVYYLIYNYIGYKFFFKDFKIVIPFLNNIFFILNKIKNISYRFYFLSNKNITARWLCRYIGIKLKNNYSFYSVINPIKKELYKLCRLRKKKNNTKLYNFINLINNNNFKYKLKFKNIIRDYFFFYIKENFLYYISNNNYMYDLYIYFNNKNKLNKFLELYKYIYVNIFINYYWELDLLKKQKILSNILYRIYNFILVNLNNKIVLNQPIFGASIFFLKNLLKFNFFKYVWRQVKKFNYRNIRSNNFAKYRGMLVGYKLAFKGRFSRKQRASNIWFMRGKMPLNTLSIKLDYHFFTIALKNSAISIKIILYKNIYKEKFKYLLIY